MTNCFFGVVLSSQVAFDKPRELAAYLTKLTHNKIESQFRKHLAIKRDIRKTLGSHQADLEFQAAQSQSQSLGTIEFLQLVLGRMSAEERHIAERRADGDTWEQIALERNSTPDAIRKRHVRTAARILEEFQANDKS